LYSRIVRYYRVMISSSAFIVSVALFSASLAASAQGPITDYDQSLCERAQRITAGVGDTEFSIEVLYGEGDGFHVIQMDADGESKTVTIATTMVRNEIDGQPEVTSVACKMVNAERLSDVLDVELPGQPQSCGEVNRQTHEFVLSTLGREERERYRRQGVQLQFADDYIAATGGEWLPSSVTDHIGPLSSAGDGPGVLTVSAPSVRVPWDDQTREFYQGTQHCKLVSAAAMQRWVLGGAFVDDAQLVPVDDQPCYAPAAQQSEAGSCLFWFAPAQSMFCQDYTGDEWTGETAAAACGKRHASPEALKAAASRYEGLGGNYSTESCGARKEAEPLGGTCVFHCNADDESLWRQSGEVISSPASAAMMSRACDLYIPARE
jgi:hypothetical protein